MLIEQRSPEWFQIRKGKITSSEVYKIMGEKGLSETAKTYLLEKVCEYFGGVTEPATGRPLEWGTELEPIAIEYYQEVTNIQVEKASFMVVDEYYGGSPDGLIQPDGIIEVKCPYKSANHFKHGQITSPATFKKIAPNYYYQCISNMICAQAEWCDFISFDPRVTPDFRMYIYRLYKDPEEEVLMRERLILAVNYMLELKDSIEKGNPKLLLG